MKNIFTEHPESIGETYLQHMKYASIFGIKMVIGGLACIIHAFLPFLFKNTGSNVLLKLTHGFIERMPDIEKRIEGIACVIDSKKNKTIS